MPFSIHLKHLSSNEARLSDEFLKFHAQPGVLWEVLRAGSNEWRCHSLYLGFSWFHFANGNSKKSAIKVKTRLSCEEDILSFPRRVKSVGKILRPFRPQLTEAVYIWRTVWSWFATVNVKCARMFRKIKERNTEIHLSREYFFLRLDLFFCW